MTTAHVGPDGEVQFTGPPVAWKIKKLRRRASATQGAIMPSTRAIVEDNRPLFFECATFIQHPTFVEVGRRWDEDTINDPMEWVGRFCSMLAQIRKELELRQSFNFMQRNDALALAGRVILVAWFVTDPDTDDRERKPCLTQWQTLPYEAAKAPRGGIPETRLLLMGLMFAGRNGAWWLDKVREAVETWKRLSVPAPPVGASAVASPAVAGSSTVDAATLAKQHGIPLAALTKRLERAREAAPDCFIEIDATERKSREPKYLYRPDRVQHIIDALKAKASVGRQSS